MSKKGFQSGAFEAARYTNIQLLTFEELQHLYGNEWFRKKYNKLEAHLAKLRQIYSLHFEQFSLSPIHNNMYFNTPELYERLCYFNHWVGNLMQIIVYAKPDGYIASTPIELASDPNNPLNKLKGMYRLNNVREYFEVVDKASKKCIESFDALFEEATDQFKNLSDESQSDMLSKVLRATKEELPIRVLKDKIGDKAYAELLEKLT